MYIFVSWSLHQATCHHQSGCAEGNQTENFNLLVDMTIFFLLGVRTRASYVELVQFLPSFHSINILVLYCVFVLVLYIHTYILLRAGRHKRFERLKLTPAGPGHF
jgi:Ca2+/Na+ antiporter